MSIRVVVADDHPTTRAGTIAILRRDPTLEVVGEAEDGAQAIAVCREVTPDLVVLDLQMPRITGIVAARRLRALAEPPRILILSGYADAAMVRAALEAGATGYALKSLGGADLLSKVHEVMRPPAQAGGGPGRKDGVTPLNPQEMITLAYIAKGLTTSQIAQQMGSSARAVEEHLLGVYQKLGAQTRSEAVLIARRERVLAEE